MIRQETGAEGVSSELWRPPPKEGNTHGEKGRFGSVGAAENAELKNSALKRRAGRSVSRRT